MSVLETAAPLALHSGGTTTHTESSSRLEARVHALWQEAEDVLGIELRPALGTTFPAFSAGAHLDLHLPNGMRRSYSLVNAPQERYRYVIGVLRERAGRGGSQCVHESLRVGMRLQLSPPRNHFALQESATHSVLVAGGIGITPLLCMARRLHSLGLSFEMVYCARSRSTAAFVEELQALGMPLAMHFDDVRGGPPDLLDLLAKRPPDARLHHYACGPAAMLSGFQHACQTLGHQNIHLERFVPLPAAPAEREPSGYRVELRRSGRLLTVAPGTSLLDTLLDAGLDIDHSCREGICGSCTVRVLAGTPEHRDAVLMEAQRTANDVMMACVSGCSSATLVLDL